MPTVPDHAAERGARLQLLVLRVTALSCLLGSCAITPAPVEPSAEESVPGRRPRPTQLVISDRRGTPSSSGELVDLTRTIALQQLELRQVPVIDRSDVRLEIEILDLDSFARDGRRLLCAKLVGRVVRSGQTFLSTDVPVERCLEQPQVSTNEHPISILIAAGVAVAKGMKERPEGEVQRLYAGAVSQLVERLASQCR